MWDEFEITQIDSFFEFLINRRRTIEEKSMSKNANERINDGKWVKL